MKIPGYFKGGPKRQQGVAREPNGRKSRKQKEEWVVYFIEADGFGLYKIGYANDVAHRLQMLAVGSPFELRVARQVRCFNREDCRNVERIFHVRFNARGYHQRGEWFRLTEALIDEAINEFFDACFQAGAAVA